MSFFQKNQAPMLPNQPSETSKREKKPASKQDKRLLGLVLGCSAASTLLYFSLIVIADHLYYWLVASFEPTVAQTAAQVLGIGVMGLYAVTGTVFLVVFIIYNRGFTRDNVTPEMLPDSMTEQEKAEFIQNGIDRKRKSKWMIVVLFALFTPLAIDFLILTAIPTLLGPIFGQNVGG